MLDDFGGFFADFGVTATVGGTSAAVIFDMPSVEIFDGMQNSENYQMTFVATDFPTLAHGQSVVVGGISYLVRQINRLDDGKLAVAQLER